MVRFAFVALGVAAAIAAVAALADLAGFPASGGAIGGAIGGVIAAMMIAVPPLRGRASAVSQAHLVETGTVGRLDMPQLRLRE
jgi:hypothetical protein